MDFQTGISHLTYKSIVDHLEICSCKVDEVVKDARNHPSGKRHLETLTDDQIEYIASLAIDVIYDWAKERRELSQIGNRPTVQ